MISQFFRPLLSYIDIGSGQDMRIPAEARDVLREVSRQAKRLAEMHLSLPNRQWGLKVHLVSTDRRGQQGIPIFFASQIGMWVGGMVSETATHFMEMWIPHFPGNVGTISVPVAIHEFCHYWMFQAGRRYIVWVRKGVTGHDPRWDDHVYGWRYSREVTGVSVADDGDRRELHDLSVAGVDQGGERVTYYPDFVQPAERVYA